MHAGGIADARLFAWFRNVQGGALPGDEQTGVMLTSLSSRPIAWLAENQDALRFACLQPEIAKTLHDSMLAVLRAETTPLPDCRLAASLVLRSILLGTSCEMTRAFVPYGVALTGCEDALAPPPMLAAVHALDVVAAGDPCDALDLESVVRFFEDYGVQHDVAMHALETLLPRFFEADPEEATRQCLRYAQGGFTRPLLALAVARYRPDIFVLHGDAAHVAQDKETERLYTCLPSGIRGLHPRIAASVLCSDARTCCLAIFDVQLHECDAHHCRWWRAFTDQMVKLHRARRVRGGAQCSVMHDLANVILLRMLHEGRRLAEAIELCEHGIHTLDTLLFATRLATGLAREVAYTTADVTRALQRDGSTPLDGVLAPPPCTGPRLTVGPAAVEAYGAHVTLLSGRGCDASRLHFAMPRWGVVTHRALYRYSEDLQRAVHALLLVHAARSGSSVARLPGELLFEIFDWLAVAAREKHTRGHQ